MTFPTPRTPEFSRTTSGATVNRVVDLPAGIQAGDLMVVFIAGAPVSGAITPPSGWVLLAGSWGNGTAGDGVYWKVAIGGETSATFVTSGASGSSFHCAMAFKDAIAAEYTFVDLDGSSSMNCPAITPSWGLADNLFCAINFWNDSGGDKPTAYPASYTLMQAAETDIAGFRVSARQSAAATEDPAAQTTSGAMSLADGVTLAIRPTVAVAAQSVSRGSYMMG